MTVSYTHLDVYKRQVGIRPRQQLCPVGDERLLRFGNGQIEPPVSGIDIQKMYHFLSSGHKAYSDAESASAAAVLNGTDLECGSSYKVRCV